MGMLDELGQAMAAVSNNAGAAVVRVGGGWRGGSGVVIGDGLVLTNAHNVRHHGVVVVFADGRRAEAEVKGVDIDGDLAVLAVDTAGSPALSWSSVSPSIGTPVFAVAAADGGARDLRFRVQRGARLPRPAWATYLGQPRAHGGARPGLVGQRPGRRRWAACRAQHESARRRVLPRAAD
jgi:hypothetical protein